MEKTLLSIEQMEEINSLLKQKAVEAGAETWQDRKEAQKVSCKFGEEGVCCRICSMGPCRITPKAPRGICGATADTIAARNFARMVAAGAAAHSDHARDIAHVLHMSSENGSYKVKDKDKLYRLAGEWGVSTEGKDLYDVAHEVAEVALMEFGKPFGTLRFLDRAVDGRKETWEKEKVAPRAIDREIATIMHSTHIGCTAEAESLVRMGLRTGLSDGWGGSMIGTELTDILFGTPTPTQTESNLGVLEEDMVNIVLHGHDPSLSEMIVLASEDAELVAYAKEKGAKGINLAGLCCTANEVTMRHGVKMAGNFLQQENAVLTGAVEAVIVDVQCIFPAMAALADCFHTKFITTSPKAKIPGATHIEFDEHHAFDSAKGIVKEAIDNYENRDRAKVYIPDSKQTAMAGYSIEAIIKQLDLVTNSHVDKTGTVKPLADCIVSGVLRGAVGIVGCNNPKVRPDYSHIEIIKNMIANDVIVVATGCAAQAAAKAGLLDKEARNLAGQGLRTVCELVDIPPVLHMGSCVDISRIILLVNAVAKHLNMDIPKLPVVGIAPEWMSEKAVAIGNYVIGSGIDTFLGVYPQVTGSAEMVDLLTNRVEDIVGAKFTVEMDPAKLSEQVLERIEAKRTALGI